MVLMQFFFLCLCSVYSFTSSFLHSVYTLLVILFCFFKVFSLWLLYFFEISLNFRELI